MNRSRSRAVVAALLAAALAVLATAAFSVATSEPASAQTGSKPKVTTKKKATSKTTTTTTSTTTTTAAPATTQAPDDASPIASTQPAFGLNSEQRKDPAASHLQLVVIGLLILAVVIALGTLVFWYATRPVVAVLGADVHVTEERSP